MMEPLDPEMKANLLQLLNGEVEEQRQGLDLADMLVPELIDQVDAMPQMGLFSEPPSAESFLNIIRTRIQEYVGGWDRFFKGNIRRLVADESPLWTTGILDDKWSQNSDYYKKTIPYILNDIDYEGDGHDTWLAAQAMNVVTKEFDKTDEDLGFKLELNWSFEIMDELNAYFKNSEDVITSLKAKELIKLLEESDNEIE